MKETGRSGALLTPIAEAPYPTNRQMMLERFPKPSVT